MAEQNVNNAKKQFFLCSKKPITKAFDGTTYALGVETGCVWVRLGYSAGKEWGVILPVE